MALKHRPVALPHDGPRGEPAAQSPVHALQGSIAANWAASPAEHSMPKVVALSSLLAIGVLGVVAWTPVAAVVAIVA
jgi:hypothetical protein